MFWNYLRKLATSVRRNTPRRPSYQPRLESLEDRALPSASANSWGLDIKPVVVHSAVKHPASATAPPVITTQPTSNTFAVGTNAKFIAAASGTPTPTVQWQIKPFGSTKFVAVAGAGALLPTLIFPATLSDNRAQFRAVFTNSKGKATTKAATLLMVVPGPAAPQPAGIHRDFLIYNSVTDDPTPIQIKTNIQPAIADVLFHFTIEGYNYGASAIINSNAAGETFGTFLVHNTVNDYAGGAALTQYLSSDGFLVLKLTSTSFFYVGLSVSGFFINPTGDVNISAVVFRSTANL